MAIGEMRSTSTRSLRLLHVDIDAALSKYHGVGDELLAAAKAWSASEPPMAQKVDASSFSET
jgi:hypothetical protein